jgi:4-amino-4-deoxy-L-arabinose transferase-like glycosyltransferase
VGLGLLAKGPLGAVAPGIVGLAWIVAGARSKPVLRLLASPTAWAVAVAVAAPWYAAMERANPGYLRHFTLYEHWGRLSQKGNRDFAPVWLYLATLPALLLPWARPRAHACASRSPATGCAARARPSGSRGRGRSGCSSSTR